MAEAMLIYNLYAASSYEETRGGLMQMSFCATCSSPLTQFCSNCFNLTPRLHHQVRTLFKSVQSSTLRERERERLRCLMSTEASRPIRDGNKWEKGDRRVKPQNRCRGPPPEQQNVTAMSVQHCAVTTTPFRLLSQLLCRTESQRQ